MGEMPLEVVSKVGSVHTGSGSEVRAVFQVEGPARGRAGELVPVIIGASGSFLIWSGLAVTEG